jgi:hypothetical protein
MKAVKPPHSLDDVNLLRQVLTDYSDGNAVVVAALISNIYILMLSFAIPGRGHPAFPLALVPSLAPFTAPQLPPAPAPPGALALPASPAAVTPLLKVDCMMCASRALITGATTLSFVAGAVFGAYRATALIAFSITAGASLCYLVSLCFGRALATWIWPVKVGRGGKGRGWSRRD